MTAFEQQYYEHPGFWDERAFSSADRERIEATIRVVPPQASELLDVGCGNGMFCNALQQRRSDLRVVGIDRSEAAVAHVRCEKHIGTIAKLPFADASFDCVSSLEVIEHLPLDIYAQALGELVRVARRWVIISVPYLEKLEGNATKCPACRTVFNVDLHLRSYDEPTMRGLLNKHGFRCELTERLGYYEQFAGHDLYRRVFFPEPAWLSPVCPLCGYQESAAGGTTPQENATQPPSKRARMLTGLKSIPKAIWPKVRRPYWILARYERV